MLNQTKLPRESMRMLLILCFLFPINGIAQSITPAQQKALNAYVEYANQSAGEIREVVESIISYYPDLSNHDKFYGRGYTCPVQLDDYYFNKAKESKSLGPISLPLNNGITQLQATAVNIDKKCKALDTYYKLEDYKQDNFKLAYSLINDIQLLLVEYNLKQASLKTGLEVNYKKLNRYIEANPYHKTAMLMRQQIEAEREFISAWSFNLNESVHTGWPIDKLQKRIYEADKEIKLFESFKPSLKYPTEGKVQSFKESLRYMLNTKRDGLDGYNFEAKKSDAHSNEVYLSLINYFNGALVSDYNGFIDFAQVDNYYGLKVLNTIPVYEIRSKIEKVDIEIKPFHDIPRSALNVVPQNSPLSKEVFNALNNYVNLINEALRQLNYLQLTISNLYSSAAYYKDLTSYKGKGGLTYEYKNFILPLSLFQQTIETGKVMPSLYVKPVNDQTEVLLSILNELDQLSAFLEIETKEKNYEKDNLKMLYERIERCNSLFSIFDEKKEQLYNDVRNIYNTYSVLNNNNSWYVSGKALQQLVDLDHEGLFKAQDYYRTGTALTITTDKIDNALREVISNEYANMKGIEKIGRNNGLCPYTPYEDLPITSKLLSKNLATLKPESKTGYSHPYHEMVYEYNDIVDDFNKFSELSKDVMLLKIVRQPELFFIKEENRITTQQQNSVTDAAKQAEQSKPKTITEKANELNTDNQVKIIHDTIIVQKRDTVYLSNSNEAIRSMEGYASNNMVLLLDVSGSMNDPNKLPLLKKSMLNLLDMMRVEDEVSIVVYSGKAKVLLAPTSFKEEVKIKNVIETLKSQGKTDGNAGLRLAYKLADENYIRGGNNRIIIATDGEFPISEDTFEVVGKFAKADIFISVFNFGKNNSTAKNLEKLSTTGKGNYEFITNENAEFKLIREVKARRK